MRRLLIQTFVVCLAVALVGGIVYAAGSKCNDFTFDATKSRAMGGQKLNYHWDFGDGTTSDQPVVTHHYERAGTYTVKLMVTDQSGMPCDTDGTSQSVVVNTPPNAVFNGPDMVCVGREVTFDATSTSVNSANPSFNWTFGDGTSAEGKTVTKTFTKGGINRVQLIVDDNQGTDCSTDCAYLNVRANTAPVANAGSDIKMTCVRSGTPFKVDFRGSGTDADGDKLTYMWNFGDGSSAEGASVSHTYEEAGTYRATLVVNDGTDSACNMDSASVNVVLSKAPQANAGSDIKECAGATIRFDGSDSVADGTVGYSWDFGDGASANGVSATHNYAKGGKYYATLTVDNGECKSSDSVIVDLNSPPTAALTGPKLVCVGDKAVFDACASSDPEGDKLTYTWDFGDNEQLVGGCSQCRVYEQGGTFTVRVIVDDGKGTPCSTDTATTTIRVNSRPIAVMAPCNACCVGVESLFDGSASSDPDGDRLTYSWDFGDGSTAEGAKVTHVYNKLGRYKVVLKVDDNVGTDCSASYAYGEANIHQGPAAVIEVR